MVAKQHTELATKTIQQKGPTKTTNAQTKQIKLETEQPLDETNDNTAKTYFLLLTHTQLGKESDKL